MAEDIVFNTGLDVTQLKKDLETARKAIEKLKAEYDRKSAGLEADSASLEQQAAQIEALKQKIAEYKAALQGGFEGGFDNFQEAFTNLPTAEAELAEMERSFNKALEKNIQLGESLEKDAAVLAEAENRANGLAAALAAAKGATKDKGDGLTGNLNKGGKSASSFSKRIAALAKGIFVFSVITSVLTGIRSALTGMVRENEELNASLTNLKSAFSLAAQPLMNVLIPALKALIDLATRAALAVANLYAKLTGKSLRDLQKGAKALGGGGKKSKSMASFDTVQTLNSGGGGGGGASGGLDINAYKSRLDELMVYISGALLALGLILCLSGANIPLGIGLMVVGAAGLAAEISVNWDSMSNSLRNALSNVLETVAGALLAIGAILTFTGAAVPLGIGLMVAGAVALAAAVGINWNSQDGFLKKSLLSLTRIAAGALLALGVLLTLTGVNVPLGIALIAAGAITLVAAASINSEIISNDVKTVLGKIASIAAGVMIALGLMLICSGFSLPIGIALLAAGALSIWTAAELNPDETPNRVNNVILTLLRIIGGALIAIGVVLCFSGAGIGIGLALIAAGALTIITTTVKIDWDSVTRKVSSVLATLLAIISGASIVVGLLLCLTGVGLGLGLALILAGIAGTRKAVSVSDNPIVNFVKGMVNAILKMVNWLISQINKIGFDIPDWVPLIGGKRFGFNIKSIPYLAQGAVIPPNREFLAVLGDQTSGTNIEAPLDTIVQAFRQVMLEGSQEIEVNFTGSMAQFVAMLDKEITISRRNRGR